VLNPLLYAPRAFEPYLKHDPLVDGELCDDVREEEVSVVTCGRINTVLAQQARPGVGHQPSQLVALLLVAGVVDVRSTWL